MPQHEIKTCPRCNTMFECKVGNITRCQCSIVELSIEERCFIEDRYSDCLCINCLSQLKTGLSFLKKNIFLTANETGLRLLKRHTGCNKFIS